MLKSILILLVGISSVSFAGDEIHISEQYKFKVPIIGNVEVNQRSILNGCYLSDEIELEAKTLAIIDISAHFSQVFDNCNRIKYEWKEADEIYEITPYDSLDHVSDIDVDNDLSEVRIDKKRVNNKVMINGFQCIEYMTKVYDDDKVIVELREFYTKRPKFLRKLYQFRKKSGLISPLEFMSVLAEDFRKQIEYYSVKNEGYLIKSDINFIDEDGDAVVKFSYEVLNATKQSGTSDVFKNLPEKSGY